MGRRYQIDIKLLTTTEEFEECIEIQKTTWYLDNYRDCIPTHMMKAVVEAGGALVGALHKKKVVAYAMSLPAISKEDGFYHYSHIMGVHPKYQGRGIGFMIKMKQREIAQAFRVKKITWTYDPLLAKNANLNIKKIGGIARKYVVDFYGSFMGGSRIVSGIPSDRFYLEWFISSKNVMQKLERNKKQDIDLNKIQRANSIEFNKRGLQKIANIQLGLSSDLILIEIPEDFQNIYNNNIKLATEWRLKSRNIFNYYLGKDYVIIDFITFKENGKKRNYYLLKKNYIPE